MSYAGWLNPSPTSGSGNGTVNVTANSDNTGRNNRQTTVTFSAANCDPVQKTVTQSGKPESSAFDSSTSTVPNTGASTLTLTGKSNSSKLTFSIGSTNELSLSAPSTYTASGTSTNNGAAITGDPGASSEYTWSIAFTIGENTTISAKSSQVIVTDDAGNTSTCTITLSAGAATLTVGDPSGNLAWNAYSATAGTSGKSITIAVTSNTSWSIS